MLFLLIFYLLEIKAEDIPASQKLAFGIPEYLVSNSFINKILYCILYAVLATVLLFPKESLRNIQRKISIILGVTLFSDQIIVQYIPGFNNYFLILVAVAVGAASISEHFEPILAAISTGYILGFTCMLLLSISTKFTAIFYITFLSIAAFVISKLFLTISTAILRSSSASFLIILSINSLFPIFLNSIFYDEIIKYISQISIFTILALSFVITIFSEKVEQMIFGNKTNETVKEEVKEEPVKE